MATPTKHKEIGKVVNGRMGSSSGHEVDEGSQLRVGASEQLLCNGLALEVVGNVCGEVLGREGEQPSPHPPLQPPPASHFTDHHLHILLAAIGGIETVVFFDRIPRETSVAPVSTQSLEVERDQGGQRIDIRDSLSAADTQSMKPFLEIRCGRQQITNSK